MAESFIYIIVHPHGDRNKICVIDLQQYLAYEKHDWCLASKNEWTDRDEAIAAARATAIKHGLTYILFESRYDEEYNEYLIDEGKADSDLESLKIMLSKSGVSFTQSRQNSYGDRTNEPVILLEIPLHAMVVFVFNTKKELLFMDAFG